MAKSKLGIGLILGAIGGAVAGLLLAPKSGKENRKLLKKKMQEVKTLVEDKELQLKIEEIVGKTGDQAKKLYEVTKKELDTVLQETKDQWEKFDKEQYKEMITDVLARVRKETKVSGEKLEELQKYLQKRWKAAGEEPKK